MDRRRILAALAAVAAFVVPAALTALLLPAALLALLPSPARAQTWDTLNPNGLSGNIPAPNLPVLSGGNLILTASASGNTSGGDYAPTGELTGKFHFECQYIGNGSGGFNNTATGCGIGAYFTIEANGSDPYCFGGAGLRASGLIGNVCSTLANVGGAVTAGDWVAVDADLTDGNVTFTDCTHALTPQTVSISSYVGKGIPLRPLVGLEAHGDGIGVNFGQSGFACSVPGGYTAGWPASAATFTHATYDPAYDGANTTLNDGGLTPWMSNWSLGDELFGATASVGKTTGKYYVYWTVGAYSVNFGVSTTLSNSYTSRDTTEIYMTSAGYLGFDSTGGYASLNGGTQVPFGAVAELALNLTDKRAWWRCAACSTSSWYGSAPGADPTNPSTGLNVSAWSTPAYPLQWTAVTNPDAMAVPAFGDQAGGCPSAPAGYTCGWPLLGGTVVAPRVQIIN